MDYNRHHGRDRRDDEEDYPPPPRRYADDEPPPPPFRGGDEPPPPFYGRNEPPPPFHGGNDPPPPFYGRNEPPPPSYGRHEPPPPFHGGNEPPPPFYGRNDPPPPSYGRHEPPPPIHGGNEYPPPSQVYHSSHIGPDHDSYPNYSQPAAPPTDENPHHHRPHMPHFPGTGDHHSHGRKDQENELTQKPSVKMYCKAEPNYSLTIRDGKVILARSDPSDPRQHWIKEEKWSTRVKDEEGFPSFALVNKATGEALKHAIGNTHPVQLTPYNPNVLDESVQWTESRDVGDPYRAIRMVNNIRLNLDAFNGDKNHGGVHDGTTIVLWTWTKGDNQWWKIVPY